MPTAVAAAVAESHGAPAGKVFGQSGGRDDVARGRRSVDAEVVPRPLACAGDGGWVGRVEITGSCSYREVCGGAVGASLLAERGDVEHECRHREQGNREERVENQVRARVVAFDPQTKRASHQLASYRETAWDRSVSRLVNTRASRSEVRDAMTWTRASVSGRPSSKHVLPV